VRRGRRQIEVVSVEEGRASKLAQALPMRVHCSPPDEVLVAMLRGWSAVCSVEGGGGVVVYGRHMCAWRVPVQDQTSPPPSSTAPPPERHERR